MKYRIVTFHGGRGFVGEWGTVDWEWSDNKQSFIRQETEEENALNTKCSVLVKHGVCFEVQFSNEP